MALWLHDESRILVRRRARGRQVSRQAEGTHARLHRHAGAHEDIHTHPYNDGERHKCMEWTPPSQTQSHTRNYTHANTHTVVVARGAKRKLSATLCMRTRSHSTQAQAQPPHAYACAHSRTQSHALRKTTTTSVLRSCSGGAIRWNQCLWRVSLCDTCMRQKGKHGRGHYYGHNPPQRMSKAGDTSQRVREGSLARE